MRKEHFYQYLSHRYRMNVVVKDGEEIMEAVLYPLAGGEAVTVRTGIPRFVDSQGYADNFGLQWNIFRSTQLDSATGLPLGFNRLWNNTHWKPKDVFGKTILEIGSGAGRFTEIMLEAGAKVVSVDLTHAVEANWKNNRHKGDLFLCRGDLYHLPFAEASFDYVFCYGVLQHTPDPQRAYRSIANMLKLGGSMSIDYYRRFRWPNLWSTPKYIWRPLTSTMDSERLLSIIKTYIPLWLPIDTLLRRIPYFGPRLLAVIPIPCWNYLHLGLNKKQRCEWAIMDTFDALGARYDFPKTLDEVSDMIHSVPDIETDIFYGGNGIVANIRRRNDHTTSASL
jgi:SAM-dependent methyltransferase